MKKISFCRHSFSGASTSAQWVNMPAALTPIYGDQYLAEFYADLQYMSHVQLQVTGGGTIFAGSKIRVQYWDGDSWEYLDGASGPSMDVVSGTFLSQYIAIVAAAKTDVLCRVVGLDGDGAADPNVTVQVTFTNQAGAGSNRLRSVFTRYHDDVVFTFTDAPAADTEMADLLVVERNRYVLDLTDFSQGRLHRNVKVAGSAGTTEVLQYSTNISSPSWTDLISISISATGVINSGFSALSGAATLVLIRHITRGGNDVADPVLGHAEFEVRSAVFNDDDEVADLWVGGTCSDTSFTPSASPCVPVAFAKPGFYKARFLYDNILWQQGIAFAVSSEATGYPKENLLDQRRSRTWRTTGKAAEWLKIGPISSGILTDLYITSHNLTSAAVIRLQANATDSWGSPTVDILVDPPVLQIGALYYIGHLLKSFFYRSATDLINTYIRITFADSGNAASYLEFGVIWPGFGTDLEINFITPHQRGLLDVSESVLAAGGRPTFARRPLGEENNKPFFLITYCDRLMLQRQADRYGTSKSFFVHFLQNYLARDNRDTAELYSSVQYGKFLALPSFRENNPRYYECDPIRFKEDTK